MVRVVGDEAESREEQKVVGLSAIQERVWCVCDVKMRGEQSIAGLLKPSKCRVFRCRSPKGL